MRAIAVALLCAVSWPAQAQEALGLRACVELADANAPRLRAVGARVREAEAGAQASRAAVRPSAALTLDFGRAITGDTERLITSVVAIDPTTQQPVYAQEEQSVPGKGRFDYSFGARVNQPIWDGRGWSGIRRADALHGAAIAVLREEALAVHLDVARAFYALARAEAQRKVIDETVEFGERHLARAEGIFAGGKGSKAEVAAARVSLGSSRIERSRNEASVEQARADLNLSIGRQPGEPLVIAPPPLDAASEASAVDDLPGLLERAAGSRAEFARLRAEHLAATEERIQAESGWWPRLGATASYGRYNNDAARFLGALGQDWEVKLGLGLTYDVYSGGATEAEVTRSQERVRAAGEAIRAAELSVAGEVGRASSAVRSLRTVRQLAADNVEAAEQGLLLAEERWRAGAGTELEVRDAGQRRAEARLVQLFAHYDLLIAQAQLRRAIGEEPVP